MAPFRRTRRRLIVTACSCRSEVLLRGGSPANKAVIEGQRLWRSLDAQPPSHHGDRETGRPTLHLGKPSEFASFAANPFPACNWFAKSLFVRHATYDFCSYRVL